MFETDEGFAYFSFGILLLSSAHVAARQPILLVGLGICISEFGVVKFSSLKCCVLVSSRLFVKYMIAVWERCNDIL